jgi:hypothetical protein
VITLNLNLDSLNNQNIDLWHSFINLSINTPNCSLILENEEHGSEFMERNNYTYEINKSDNIFDFKVTYPNSLTELDKDNKNILLIDKNNKHLLIDNEPSEKFYIASRNTANELGIGKSENTFTYILLNESKICIQHKINSDYIIISDQDTPITNSLNHCFHNKLGTSVIKHDLNCREERSVKTIIYNGDEPSHIHGFINSKNNYSIKNINKEIFISSTRMAFDFNQELYQIICNLCTNNESSLREYINLILKEGTSSLENNFLNLNQQLNKDFQNLIKNINEIENIKHAPINALYLIPLKISIHDNKESSYDQVLEYIYHHLFTLIEKSKYDINLTFQILVILLRFNDSLLIKYCEYFIEKTKNKPVNIITSNHILWFLSSLLSENHDFDIANINSPLLPYLRHVDNLNSGNTSELSNLDDDDLFNLLNLVYSIYIFNSKKILSKSINPIIDSSFEKIKHSSLFRKLELLTQLVENKVMDFTDFQSSLYGGTVSLRNLHYQFIFKKLNEGKLSVDPTILTFIQNHTNESSFDNLFQLVILTVFNSSKITSEISGINLNKNPWFENNTYFCLVFHYYIFYFFNHNQGINLIESISNILKFKINEISNLSFNCNINQDVILDTLIDFTNDYYLIIK